MNYKEILFQIEEGVGVITLNRPETMNAVTPQMTAEVADVVEGAKFNEKVGVLVITGAGKAFCAGANPRRLASQEEDGPRLLGIPKLPLALRDFDKPVIAAVNGAAAGGGMDLASMCDIRIASERAKFTMAYVRMGIVPATGGCYFLPRIVGVAKACELIWTGRTIDAQEALRIGYVSQVVLSEELMITTMELAHRLARGPMVAIRLSKRLIYQGLGQDLLTALSNHELARWLCAQTEDAKEGPRAWVEKREPIFKGR